MKRFLPLLLLCLSASAAETRVLRDVPYVENGAPSQRLDLLLPAGEGPRPLVVFIHGGAWKGGDKRNNPAARLAERGYAVASINYRLSQEAVFPAQIHDCKAAIRFLRGKAGEYGIDPDRVAVWGSSAGGHLVALLGVTGDVPALEGTLGVTNQSSRVQAVVNFFGPANLLTMGAQSGPDSRIRHDAPDSPESELIGGAVQENAEKARAASPVTHVSPGDAPMLLVHGDADPLVPVQQSRELHEALRKAGVDSTLRVVPGGGHGNNFPGRELANEVDAFLERVLKPGP